MKKRVICFLLSLILIMTSTVVVVPSEVKAATTVVKNYDYTGKVQMFVAPQDGTYTLEVWGAQGGTAYNNSNYEGGKGGYSKGIITLKAGDILYIYVGGKGSDSGTGTTATLIPGGFNGGGAGAMSIKSGNATNAWSGGGGGATDIRINSDSLYARAIVAGGGSGGSYSNRSGTTDANGKGYAGGGEVSEGYDDNLKAMQNKAGTGGSFGKGAGVTNATSNTFQAAGAGGGWYGGGIKIGATSGLVTEAIYARYSGGGSGYVYTSSTASSYPSGCLLNSSYYLTETTIVDGATSFPAIDSGNETGHSGNGYARITYTKTKSDPRYEETNFSYTGEVQTYTISKTGDYLLEVWGAQGGTAYNNSNYEGGKGGYSKGIITLKAGDILYIYVGGKGSDSGTGTTATLIPGGFNGGGAGAMSIKSGYSTNAWSGGGGGATDIRINSDSLYARAIVAGGGSGGSYSNRSGTTDANGKGYAGGGKTSEGYDDNLKATQTKAGTGGSFGKGAGVTNATSNTFQAAGAGGGWYGGGIKIGATSGLVTEAIYARYSGGGSGYVYTSSTASSYPSGCLLNSTYYLRNAYAISGAGFLFPATEDGTEEGHSDNGYARVSLIIGDETPPTVTFEANGSTTYVAKASTKVTVSDESGIDANSLKYQWTQSTTAPAASTFTETFANGETITFSGQGGTWYLWILAADTIGNTSIISSKSFIIDCIAPSGTISIVGKLEKNGYKYTNDKTLTINLTATDDISSTSKIKMALINENDFSLSNSNSEIQWMNFSATKTWTPSSGDGLKTIYVIFKDEAGNQSIYLAE